MIKEVQGDILLSGAQAIAHGVSPNDNFAQGLALSLREQWPALYKDFRHYCHDAHPKAGDAWLWGAADGTRIVDGEGREVVMRGVALGGWNFHENWITAVDYPAHARLHVIGEEAGHGADVDAAIVDAGPDDDGDEEWTAAVRAGLEARLGADTADALLWGDGQRTVRVPAILATFVGDEGPGDRG